MGAATVTAGFNSINDVIRDRTRKRDQISSRLHFSSQVITSGFLVYEGPVNSVSRSVTIRVSN